LNDSNPFKDNRGRYGCGSFGDDHGDTRDGYEYNKSAGCGAPQYEAPRAFVEYEYRCEEAPTRRTVLPERRILLCLMSGSGNTSLCQRLRTIGTSITRSSRPSAVDV
jgi:hypothetical protein